MRIVENTNLYYNSRERVGKITKIMSHCTVQSAVVGLYAFNQQSVLQVPKGNPSTLLKTCFNEILFNYFSCRPLQNI